MSRHERVRTRRAPTGVAGAQSRVAQAEAVVALRDLVFGTKAAYYELARALAVAASARAGLERATGAVPADRLPVVSSQARRPQ